MVKLLRLFLLSSLIASLFGCSKTKSATELILVADTDIADLESIRFVVTGDGRTESEEAPVRSDGVPLTLGLVLENGERGPLVVSALGIRDGGTVVERSATVSFVAGRTLVVELHLLASCENRRCGTGETCIENACASNALQADDLEPWTGTAPTLEPPVGNDGGLDGGRDGATNLVTCGSATQVDLSSDVDHCGDCATACKAPNRNTVATCVAGACAVECRTLYGDCDQKESNGCEQLLTVNTNCGMCGARCETGTSCAFGSCR